jgi:serine/threonine protein kinase
MSYGSPESVEKKNNFSARYKVQKRIGTGRNGVVYLGHDLYRKRDVAIKFSPFNDQYAHEGSHKKWMEEVQSINKIKHPFIVEVYEAGVVKEGCYVVMEYLPFPTLWQFIHTGNLLPVDQVVEILFKLCKAAEQVHSNGILHCDIRPNNIFLKENGDIKVSDFSSFSESTRNDDLHVPEDGTFDYLCPELLKNEPPNMQSDIYAIGVLGYQMLTGHKPYLYQNENHVYQRLFTDPFPLTEWRPDLPLRLSKTILRSIALDPSQRFKKCSSLSLELEKALLNTQKSKEVTNDSNKFAIMSKLGFFREFEQKELWETVQISDWVRRQPGDTIVSEGDSGTSIYVILKGEADVLKTDVKISVMKAGSCFGELAYLEKAPNIRTATVIASTELLSLCIDGTRLRKSSIALRARFSDAFLRAILVKIQKSDSRILSLTERVVNSSR